MTQPRSRTESATEQGLKARSRDSQLLCSSGWIRAVLQAWRAAELPYRQQRLAGEPKGLPGLVSADWSGFTLVPFPFFHWSCTKAESGSAFLHCGSLHCCTGALPWLLPTPHSQYFGGS